MRANDSLVLYKRHTAKCKVHQMRLAPREKNFWFACDCPFAMTGRTPTGDTVPRQTIGVMTLKEAEAYRNATIRNAAAAAAPVPGVKGIAFTEAINRYLTSRQDTLGEKTSERIRIVLEKMSRYAIKRGILHMGNLTADLVEQFKEDEFKSLKSTTRAVRTAQVRCFLREAFRRDWTDQALAEKVRPYLGVYEQKDPYTPEHLRLLLAEAEHLRQAPNRLKGYCTHAHTFRVLLELMNHTGLRVSDAVMFNPAGLHRADSVWVYTFTQRKTRKGKAPKSAEVYLSDWMKDMIDGCVWLSEQLPFAYMLSGRYKEAYLCQTVYYTMQLIGERCGVPDCRPHRLRDTFAVTMLQSGIPLEDVSRLLGHSSVKTTEVYYARWTPGRRLRLQGIVAEAFLKTDNSALGNQKAVVRTLPAAAVN